MSFMALKITQRQKLPPWLIEKSTTIADTSTYQSLSLSQLLESWTKLFGGLFSLLMRSSENSLTKRLILLQRHLKILESSQQSSAVLLSITWYIYPSRDVLRPKLILSSWDIEVPRTTICPHQQSARREKKRSICMSLMTSRRLDLVMGCIHNSMRIVHMPKIFENTFFCMWLI